MRALVTGATGFVGSYLTQLLVERGEPTAILLRPDSDTWRITGVLPPITQIKADLLALHKAEAQIQEFAPDTVFHLAWHGVGNAYRNDPAQIDSNLNGSLALLRLAVKLGCRTWVGLGSQAEYGPQNAMLDETARTEPSTLYGAMKLCIYLLGKQLAAQSGMRFAWLRLFSAYGPRDNEEWMIPYLIRALARGEKPSLTAGEQKWDYLYVADAAAAIYNVAATPNAKGAFNLGSGQAYTLRGIIERIRDMIDPSLPLGFGEVPYRPDQVMYLQADIGRLRQITGWEPRTSLDEGLRQTIEWYTSKEGASR